MVATEIAEGGCGEMTTGTQLVNNFVAQLSQFWIGIMATRIMAVFQEGQNGMQTRTRRTHYTYTAGEIIIITNKTFTAL